jgi:uncharacterized protein (TIGR02001 family)
MKIKYLVIPLISFTFITPANAIEGLTANVALSSNYLWRDLEQTNGDAAVSGGIDYTVDSGFYVGSWVSNASWSEGMTYELDIYGGYANQYKELTYDVGFVHYAYPDSTDNVDFTEVNVSMSYGVFSFSYAVLANADNVDFGDDSYLSLSADFEVAPELNLSLHVARGTDEFYAGESFTGYGASISKEGFTLGVSKTDLDNTDMKLFISYEVDFDL